ncbi:DUF305 domain-containing protein [Knoellia aerolata]|uniref:DUF305 domain-containing protein n=1 Tax=Knoellia aerolata DSM 18566 TaxID=1385519 RepID=A0A0A0K2D9_9MICO|nr:DUF305 domain-containing protein [Knoellia aerolata]KGN41931.1 hypothetical protein N801_03540 [Knoellia aerolata DSM 18566]
MRVRALVLVVALGLAGGLSGCGIDDLRSERRHGGPMRMTMVSSEATYLAEMIPHHEEAVRAAEELARSPRATMREFGEDIVRTQTAQIVQMREWLRQWYPDQAEDTTYRPMMRDLTRLEGDALDRTFLQDMVGHHMMAVMMSQHLLRDGTTHPEVEDLAQEISDEQRREIRQMSRWLAAWFGLRTSGMHGGMQPQ